MTEVERRKVEKIDDQYDLSPYEVRSNEQHDECKLEEVVDNEMTSDWCCGVDMFNLVAEQMKDISNLKDEEE